VRPRRDRALGDGDDGPEDDLDRDPDVGPESFGDDLCGTEQNSQHWTGKRKREGEREKEREKEREGERRERERGREKEKEREKERERDSLREGNSAKRKQA
jgi:hypothetical protein